jgi:hypothetical protein
MAAGVVHHLELVEVTKSTACRSPSLRAEASRRVAARLELPAIREVGEGVVRGLPREVRLRRLARRLVGEKARDHVGQLPRATRAAPGVSTFGRGSSTLTVPMTVPPSVTSGTPE